MVYHSLLVAFHSFHLHVKVFHSFHLHVLHAKVFHSFHLHLHLHVRVLIHVHLLNCVVDCDLVNLYGEFLHLDQEDSSSSDLQLWLQKWQKRASFEKAKLPPLPTVAEKPAVCFSSSPFLVLVFFFKRKISNRRYNQD